MASADGTFFRRGQKNSSAVGTRYASQVTTWSTDGSGSKMIQDLLAEPDWDDVLTPEDQRGLTPLFWSHVLPYSEVKLNMASRLSLGSA